MPDFYESVFSFPIDLFRAVVRPLDSWQVQQPSLPCWRLWWNSTPGASVTWRGRRFELEPDSVVLVAPDTEFKTALACPVSRHLFIHFELGSLAWNCTDQVFSVRPPAATLAAVRTLVKRLLDTGDPVLAHPLAALSLIASLLELVDVSAWTPPPADPRLRRVLAAIADTPGADWSDAALARLAAMSVGGFARLFRTQNRGLPPQAWVQRQRLALARQLLMQDSLSIDAIAERCGFCDRSYFSTVFRREIGIPPAKYRMQTR